MHPIFNLLSVIRNILVNWFVFIHRHAIAWRVAFLVSLIVASVKAAVRLFGFVFNTLSSLLATSNTVGNSIASQGIGVPVFDKLNAVLPVAETLAFMSAYLGVLSATTLYMVIRSAYNAIPLKAT